MSLIRSTGIPAKLNQLRKYVLYGPRSSTRSYVARLNGMGARIHPSLYMPTPESVFLDDTNPYLLEIGEHVFLAAGVKILTHDAGWLAMKCEDGVVRGHTAPVRIGRNVFIGMNSVVLCNVAICDNVIIGTNSVVDRSITVSGVYAGNPAKLVATYESYKALRDGRQVREAYTLVKCYYERFGKKPPQEILNEYFWIFAPRDLEQLPSEFRRQLCQHGDFETAKAAFLGSQPDFDGYEDFWQWCFKRMERGREKGEADQLR